MDAPIRSLEPAQHFEALAELAEPPSRLWARGSLPRHPAVAIVGTRRADRDALAFTRRLAAELAEAGAAVISGGAEGIDAAAHRGALDAGGRTWVVQAAPLDAPYPRRHRRLFEAVLEADGGWLSETPPGEPAYPSRFLARNRLVAALADAVVVVQAPARSGALSTARHAEALERPLFAVPHAPWDPRGAGGNRLLGSGARPCLSARDVVGALPLRAPPSRPARPARSVPALPPALRRVHDALATRPRHADALASELGLPAAEVQVALVQLAAAGLARQEGHGWRAR
ncbi:MAG TPA: DNA-processing protein DprA [Sandaracinaceae bacterium LLY-WYZ-13_1]|nr:DNA-processing protein DprA [Sandaracinaceae bacterium LLY-WYZ-13_1]